VLAQKAESQACCFITIFITIQDIQPVAWGPWWAKGWEQAPCTLSKFGTAVQFYIYYYPAGCSWVYFRAPRPHCKK